MTATTMLSELPFDGDYVFANRNHAVGIYVEAWGTPPNKILRDSKRHAIAIIFA
ncbi:hypothetical protein SH449x_003412 [Pirellulaceae bacterium SH449]